MDEITYMRQTDLADPLNLKMPINIIGAGSIGSWSALALTKLGCTNVTVWDADLVERHNAGSQIYTGYDDGKSKVDALKQKIDLISNEKIEVKDEMWTNAQELPDDSIVISAVDTMAVRAELAQVLAEERFGL
jgi:tRNA A37 threonylcarbamoyladenosine dehydratase